MGGKPPSATPPGRHTHDLAVVGAGVIGLSVAFHAASRGIETAVFERSRIAAEASGVQPGGVRQQWSTDVNCLLARESFNFYRAVNDHLDSRVRPVLEQCGYVFLAHSKEALEQLARNVELQRGHGIPSQVITAAELGDVVQGLSTDEVVGASYCPEDGYFDKPQGVVEAFAQAAVGHGATIELSEVTGLHQNGGGWELILKNSERVFCDRVVVAASYDTNALLASLGVKLPLTKAARYLFLSDPIRERLLEPLVISQELHFAAKHLADGRVLASDLSANGDPTTHSAKWREHVRVLIERLLPILEYVSFPVLVEGSYDMTPDSQGIVSPLAGVRGFVGRRWIQRAWLHDRPGCWTRSV